MTNPVSRAVLFGQISKLLTPTPKGSQRGNVPSIHGGGMGRIRVSRDLHAKYTSARKSMGKILEDFKDFDLNKPAQVGQAILSFLDHALAPPPSFSQSIEFRHAQPLYHMVGKSLGDFTPYPDADIWRIIDIDNSILCHALTRDVSRWKAYHVTTIPEFEEIKKTLPPALRAMFPEDTYLIRRVFCPFNYLIGHDEAEDLLKRGLAIYHVAPVKLLKKPDNFNPTDPSTYPREFPNLQLSGEMWKVMRDQPAIHTLEGSGWLFPRAIFEQGLPPDQAVNQALLKAIWSHATEESLPYITLHHVGYNEISYRLNYSAYVSRLEEDFAPYVGPELELLDEWIAYMDKQVPLTVLLQGRPGSGKTTLVKTAIQTFFHKRRSRILALTAMDFAAPKSESFHNLIEAFAPDVVFIEDIDRLPREHLDLALAKIDRQVYKVPLTIFTSNNFRKLPQAFYRPDRIDYIYKIDVKPGMLSEQTLQAALARVGIKPDELDIAHLEHLKQLARGRTPAEILKYVRRGYVLGFDKLQSGYDLDIHMQDETEESP